jgi:hypothetical protein
MLGRSSVDVICSWPSDGPPIFVGTGLPTERDSALAVLARTNSSYVTDALTLTELVNFGVPEALAGLPKVYITPVTMGILEENLRDAEEDKSIGTAIDIGGQLNFIEFDDEYRELRITFAKELVEAAKKYCTVQPAYGELTPPENAPQFFDILTGEERELLLLAKDCSATLLTLDGRLRMLAKFGVKVDGVWPQALLTHCLHTDQIQLEKGAEFSIKAFLTNRRFVSLRSNDLVWMVLQGDSYIQKGIQAFKQHLQSAETEVGSATTVALEFLDAIAGLEPQFGAFGELLVHIMEAIYRRQDLPSNFNVTVDTFVFNLTAKLGGVPHPYPPLKRMRAELIHKQREYLHERLVEARNWSSKPVEPRPIAVRVLYCTKIPFLILDKSSSQCRKDVVGTALAFAQVTP